MHWWPQPDVGDIVWCRFPEQILGNPGPKPRPSLVVKVGDRKPHMYVQVIYGTSKKTDKIYPSEFLIKEDDKHAYQKSGLRHPTKFNFNTLIELPYNNKWFEIPSAASYGKCPKMGILDTANHDLMRRVKSAWEKSTIKN